MKEFKQKKILYCTDFLKSMIVLIPKRKQKGYLKAPFGGTHANDLYWNFLSLDGQQYINNCCDIDGYLEITLNIFDNNNQDEEYKKAIKQILKDLIKVFNHCDSFEKINNRNEIFDIILNK